MRYLVWTRYLGKHYVGWQRQPNGLSVQQEIEGSLTTLLRTETAVTGCGRTDAGVHGAKYAFHFDADGEVPPNLVYKLNRILPDDVAILSVQKVNSDFHARFSAVSRSYTYYLGFEKDPFRAGLVYRYPKAAELNFDVMNEAGDLMMQFNEFKPFCKTGSDTPHYLCDLKRAQWSVQGNEAVFDITANRFLRGMVRLIVGSMLQIGSEKMSLDELREVLERQSPLSQPVSAPAHGLHLTHVRYDQISG